MESHIQNMSMPSKAAESTSFTKGDCFRPTRKCTSSLLTRRSHQTRVMLRRSQWLNTESRRVDADRPVFATIKQNAANRGMARRGYGGVTSAVGLQELFCLLQFVIWSPHRGNWGYGIQKFTTRSEYRQRRFHILNKYLLLWQWKVHILSRYLNRTSDSNRVKWEVD